MGAVQHAGFVVDEVRDAPDRPGREWVFVARAGYPAGQGDGTLS